MIIKSPVFWTIAALVILTLVILLGVYQGIAISLAVLSIIISTFFASRSLRITDESLKLTRNTVRPFLSVQPGDSKVELSKTTLNLYFEIKNTGALPGELVFVELMLFGENEIVTNDNDSKKYPQKLKSSPMPILFPNAFTHLAYAIDMNTTFGSRLWEDIRNGKVKARHRIIYKDKNIEYTTIQTEHLLKVNVNILRRKHIPPQYWT